MRLADVRRDALCRKHRMFPTLQAVGRVEHDADTVIANFLDQPEDFKSR